MQPANSSTRPRAFVRVLGVRRATFIDFSFALGDPDLSVELCLPLPAFDELCARYDVVRLASADGVAQAFHALERTTR